MGALPMTTNGSLAKSRSIEASQKSANLAGTLRSSRSWESSCMNLS
jgi:hypothetical protein